MVVRSEQAASGSMAQHTPTTKECYSACKVVELQDGVLDLRSSRVRDNNESIAIIGNRLVQLLIGSNHRSFRFARKKELALVP